MLLIIAISVLVLLSAVLLIVRLKFIQPNELAIKTFLGIPTGELVESGPTIVIWPLMKLFLYTTAALNFVDKVLTVTTKEGKVEGEEDRTVKRVDLTINFKIAVYFSDNYDRLLLSLKHLPDSTMEGLAATILPFVKDQFRGAAGEAPWVLINEEKFKFLLYVRARLIPNSDYHDIHYNEESHCYGFEEELKTSDSREKMLLYNPLVQIGLDERLELSIDNLEIDAKSPVSQPELERYKKIAADQKTDADAYAIRKKGSATATATAEMGVAVASSKEELLKAIKEYQEAATIEAVTELGKGQGKMFISMPVGLQKILDKFGQ